MSHEHPITPPPELVNQWLTEGYHQDYCTVAGHAIVQAARWGADQELEACCEHLKRAWAPSATIDNLRTARRPKSPNLKEQALDAWIRLRNEVSCEKVDGDLACILRVLESLPEEQ